MYHDFLSKMFCLTVPKNSVGESCIVALISGTKKVWKGGGGGVSRCSVEVFLSHTAENFRRGNLYCCINFGPGKFVKEGGKYQDYPSKSFCLTVPKIFVGESSIVAIISGTEKFWKAGGCLYFLSKVFCVTLPKISLGKSSIVALISGTEKV